MPEITINDKYMFLLNKFINNTTTIDTQRLENIDYITKSNSNAIPSVQT